MCVGRWRSGEQGEQPMHKDYHRGLFDVWSHADMVSEFGGDITTVDGFASLGLQVPGLECSEDAAGVASAILRKDVFSQWLELSNM